VGSAGQHRDQLAVIYTQRQDATRSCRFVCVRLAGVLVLHATSIDISSA
jgi:hypothetical protein